ncbi:hypothetical protein A4X09_0g1728 [Tilletia walkeri]|uniref:NUC153 domain-containing protein n=1 Tax=Tilletia walkeri TaxID=117179 RepID=A0A8X7NCP9_9BASI|nr:hypothetical protein A4X09_0g1728 [Tilletia walkeri]
MPPKDKRTHAPAVSDPRFKRAQNDPRFLRPKKETFQAVLDDRFKDLLQPGGQPTTSKSKVDKYGRKIRGDVANAEEKQLRGLYRIEGDNQDDEDEEDDDDEDDDDEDEEDEDEEDNAQPQAGPSVDYARGEADLLSSSDDDSDSSLEDLPSDDDYSSVDEDELQASTSQPQSSTRPSSSKSAKEELRGDRTRRIAVVNMDWDYIRARDLYMVFSSLVSPTATHLPESTTGTAAATAAATSNGKRAIGQALQVKGRVLSVRVYPSEFGRERMKKEDVEGPPRDIFKNADEQASSSSSRKKKNKRRKRKGGDGDDDEDDEEEEITAKTIVQVDEGGDFDEEALRKYQLERLRYYYAVAEFDSVDSASHVYNEIDGTEMERSANVFDLRFIPDEMDFPTYPLQSDEAGKDDGWRDEVTFEDSVNGSTGASATTATATTASSASTAKYRPLDFKTDALRHSRVKLTWDADDPERTRITKNVFASASVGKKAKKGKKGAQAGILTLDEMRDDDFKAYLASATEDEDEEGEEEGAAGRARLRALLNLDGGGGGEDGAAGSGSEEEGDGTGKAAKKSLGGASSSSSVWGRSRVPNAGGRPGVVEGEMEITFTPGLSEAKGRKESKEKEKKKTKKGEEEEESTLDKYKRKQREKKERKLAERGGNVEEKDEGEEEGTDAGFDDPFFTKDGDVDRAMAAALEAHDRGASESAIVSSTSTKVTPSTTAAAPGTKSKTTAKREAKLERKRKRKAKANGTILEDTSKDADDDGDDNTAANAEFDVDVSDPRFGALMEDHRFALDPSHKAWKETKGMRKLVDERRKKARRN